MPTKRPAARKDPSERGRGDLKAAKEKLARKREKEKKAAKQEAARHESKSAKKAARHESKPAKKAAKTPRRISLSSLRRNLTAPKGL